jgi:hypothetical protein
MQIGDVSPGWLARQGSTHGISRFLLGPTLLRYVEGDYCIALVSLQS